MTSNQMRILTTCMAYCVEHPQPPDGSYSLDELHRHCIGNIKQPTTDQTSSNDVYYVLKRGEKLFRINLDKQDEFRIRPLARLDACRGYQSSSCSVERCTKFHICEKSLIAPQGCRKTSECKQLSHSLQSQHNRGLFRYYKIESDPAILLAFIRLFHASPSPSVASPPQQQQQQQQQQQHQSQITHKSHQPKRFQHSKKDINNNNNTNNVRTTKGKTNNNEVSKNVPQQPKPQASPRHFELRESLDDNVFLRVFFAARNKPWHDQLNAHLAAQNACAQIPSATSSELVIASLTTCNPSDENRWSTVVLEALDAFFEQYHVETISYTERSTCYELDIRELIDELNRSRQPDHSGDTGAYVDHVECRETSSIFLVGPRRAVHALFERLPRLRYLSQLYDTDPDCLVRVEHALPALVLDAAGLGLVRDALGRLVKLYNVLEYSFDSEARLVRLLGVRKCVNELLTLIDTKLGNMRRRRLDIGDAQTVSTLLKISDLAQILQATLADLSSRLLFSVQMVNDVREASACGIHVTYFHDFAEIDAFGHSVHDKVLARIAERMCSAQYDASGDERDLAVLMGAKWAKFEAEELSAVERHKGVLWHRVLLDERRSYKVVLIGEACDVEAAMKSVRAFFRDNRVESTRMRLSEEDVSVCVE